MRAKVERAVEILYAANDERTWTGFQSRVLDALDVLRAALMLGDKKCRHPDSCERNSEGFCGKCYEEMR